ncbi:VOC family protein [Companilactobacillus keshanensis]|uniref:VOC family protein n=1 Tax=Companilactobacillus keshanensis TaxID=2486003 RepID=A0ABW4BW04_9LACO|nr:glyoxalase/bleomycin resistance/extradiol dioxygenase family protein [Companilactobacillus keshanensis]
MQSQIYPYFAFKNAKSAIEYYQEVFGATEVYRLSPKPEQAKEFDIPEGVNLDDLTMHAGFTILGMKVECADAFTGNSEPSGQVSLLLDINSEDPESAKAADDFYEKLEKSDDVEITMPFEEQFWGGKMGGFTDKYGINWMLHTSPWSKSVDHS